ncbi:MAG TPA: carboxypeptidase-like regulatory domain-containing protein [Pyrinomonadaceae bacterium]
MTRGPAYSFNDAKVVFIGRMLGGTQKLSIKDRTGKTSTLEAGQVRFSVEETYKGSNAEELTIQIDSHEGTSCGPYGLKRGERYVVYAYVSNTDEKVLWTGVCTRTTSTASEYAKEDLDFLRNLPPAGIGGELHGSIYADLKGDARPVLLSDVRVKISGPDDQTITVFTDKNGEFTVKQLKPGKYKVEPEFPPNYTSETKSEEVMIDDRGRAAVGFEMYIDGKVSGRVFDKEGNNFNSAFLKLVGEGKTVSGFSTGDDGVFEIEGAPPGEYVLTLEMQSRDYNKNKLYYYPGTFAREKAAKIRVGLGERVDGLEFRLPAEFVVRTIEGEVAWDDGTPAAGVQVHLLCPRSSTADGFTIEFSPASTQTDNEGRFRLEGFSGETYWLEARGSKAGKSPMHSPSRKLSINGNVKNLKLTLSKAGRFGGGCR